MGTTKDKVRSGGRARGAARDVVSVLFAGAIVLTARSSLADHYYVPSGSMEPTVQVADRILVNKLAYGVRVPLTDLYAVDLAEPARGDVVVLSSPEDGTVLLKRVVAKPGDRVHVVGGELEINGARVPVSERDGGVVESLGKTPHPLALDSGGGPDFGPVTVPPDNFLVLGDNRGNSKDGRFFGFVERAAIKGRAVAIIARAGTMTWIAL